MQYPIGLLNLIFDYYFVIFPFFVKFDSWH